MMKSMSTYKITLAVWMYLFLADKKIISGFVPTVKTAITTTNENNSLPTLRTDATKTPLSQLSALQGVWKSFEKFTQEDSKNENQNTSPGAKFLNAVNDKNIDEALTFIIDTEGELDGEEGMKFEYEDTAFPDAWKSPQELERELRLRSEVSGNSIIVIDEEIYDAKAGKSGVAFHLEGSVTDPTEKKGAAFFDLNDDGLIRKAFIVTENNKSGESSLKILKLASEIIGVTKDSTGDSSIPSLESSSVSASKSLSSLTLPEEYFNGWNQRDMKQAISVFAQDVEYDDTAFPKPIIGRDNLERHLNVCAKAMPSSFSFVVDDKIDAGNKVMVRWHVESNSEELPYTRGCSCYTIEDGKIAKGTDLKEPAVFKTGGLSLFIESFLSKVKEEPIRIVPTAVWATYIYVVFFSSWFFGLPATSLEVRTWEEVRDLSLNFFLVSPILGLPFAPVVHPGLEGIFNLLLSWAAMFAGFLSDDRKRKPNLLPMLPIVVGMQFLTSAFLLPYLATRSTEDDVVAEIPRDEITTVIRVTENNILGLAMGFVGTGSIFWGLFARSDDFGDLATRYASLMDLLSIDRVGSSFLVDLAIFGLFQGWLVDDDAKRRGMDSTSILVKIAKYVPFFGLAAYLASRSEILVADEEI
jgi:hypothetical protein